MSGYGDIFTSALNYESNRREGDRKARSLKRYNLAQTQIGEDQARDDFALQFNQGLLSDQRYGDENQLAYALGSPNRTGVGERERQSTYGRLDEALQPVQGNLAMQTRGDLGGFDQRNAQRAWAGGVGDVYAPRLASQRAMIGEEGAQRGMTTYDNAAYNRLGDQEVDLGRQSSDLTRRYGLMAQYRDQLLANEGRRFKYQGPSSSYYNMQLVGQLGGAGINAGSAYATGTGGQGGTVYGGGASDGNGASASQDPFQH